MPILMNLQLRVQFWIYTKFPHQRANILISQITLNKLFFDNSKGIMTQSRKIQMAQ